jgi:hypothetical protein
MDKNSTKRFFIDYYCYGILNHLLTLEDFKSKNIERDKITKINTKEKGLDIIRQITEDVIIFIIRPDRELFNVVLEIHLMLRALRPKGLTEHLIFIPRENYDIIEYMTTNNMIGDFNIENLNIDLIPIDIDLLSLEKEDSIKEIYIDKNLSCVSDLANAVVKLETCFGKIKYKYIKGDLAQTFCDTMEEKEKENNLKENEDEILGMIVLDRSVDFITLMTTNYTCEGLIDENIGINLGRIKVNESMLTENLNPTTTTNKINNVNNNNQQKEKIVQYGLTTNINKFFCAFRCMHYLDALKYIKTYREYYQKLFTNKNSKLSATELKNMTEELQYFMNNIKKDLIMNENLINFVIEPLIDKEHLKYIEKEQLLLAGDIPDNLHNYYDEILCEQKDLISLIKLMIIESLTQNGIQGYQKLKREILNIYGFQKIFLFRDLENLGWLKEKQLLKNLKNIIDFTYSQINEKLELIKENYQPLKIEDCSYVLSGYCPISIKIIEKAVNGEWNTIIDVLRKMPGFTSCPEDEKVIKEPAKDRNIMFIIFIGGVTYTEIEAIRFLNRKFNEENLKGKRKKTQFIILTTGILNSKKILQNLGKDVYSALNMKMFFEQTKKK